MAIFHLSVKCISRSKGDSAVAAAAYRAGVLLTDRTTGEVSDYTKRRGVVSTSLHFPAGTPRLIRSEVWNRAEEAEKRKNSTVAREVEVSLPHELNDEIRSELAEELAEFLCEKYQVVVDVAIHAPTGEDKRNHHAHLLMTTRAYSADGKLGAKTRILDAAATGGIEVEAWRAHWSQLVNAALKQHGIDQKIDHRSFERQGIDRVPTMHVGRGKGASLRRKKNDEIAQRNEHIAAVESEEAKVRAEALQIVRERQIAELVIHARQLPTAAEVAHAQRHLAVAQRQAAAAQSAVALARRHIEQRRWWNPVSVYRAIRARQQFDGLQHNAGALGAAAQQIDKIARSKTREHVLEQIEALREYLPHAERGQLSLSHDRGSGMPAPGPSGRPAAAPPPQARGRSHRTPR